MGSGTGELFVDRSANPDGDIVIAGNDFREHRDPGAAAARFSVKPVAIYHDPDLPPSHHYLAAYRWVAGFNGTGFGDNGFRADAVVHVGKHGNLEWLPGKTLGMSSGCGTDAALGDLPLIYPFLVNDPGEGTQAKRRAHAVLVDHLIRRWRGRRPTATSPDSNSSWTSTPTSRRSTRRNCPPSASRSGPCSPRPRWTTTWAWQNAPTRTYSTTCCCT